MGGAQAVPVFAKLLQHPKMNIVKEAAWTISNITAGNSTQIQVVMDAGVLQPLIDILVKGDFKAQKEAAWAVTNLTSGGTVQQIVHLCGEGVLKPFCDLLAAKDDKTVGVVLDGVANILATAEKLGESDKVATMVEECGGLDRVEALQSPKTSRSTSRHCRLSRPFSLTEKRLTRKLPQRPPRLVLSLPLQRVQFPNQDLTSKDLSTFTICEV